MNINKENYEEYLFDYMEGNLSAEEHAELTAIIEADPFLQSELKAFEQTILVPNEDMVYPYKEELLKEKKRRIIPLYAYISVSVAAAIALLAIVFIPDTTNPTLPGTVAENNHIESNDSNPDSSKKEVYSDDVAPITAENTDDANTTNNVYVNRSNKTSTPVKVSRASFDKIDPVMVSTVSHTYPLKQADKIENTDYINAPELSTIALATKEQPTERDKNTRNNSVPLVPAFKQAVFEQAGDIWSSIKKPKITLFARDEKGKKKLQLILQYDTYQALIRVR